MSFPRIKKGFPALVLAPMEGYTDAPMRRLLTDIGGFDFCVSEFLRVSQTVLNSRAVTKSVPELKNKAKTSAGIPVQVQLLGGDPERLAHSARVAVEAGAPAIDLNFGCPAPTVNRHDGGATLLKFPERIYKIIKAVRDYLPTEIPVSAKFRLGWDDDKAILENAKCAEQAGASWITIHGRTKTQGYRPPAFWKPIASVVSLLKIPVVANGDIWTIENFIQCREETGAEHFMLGRGALADPFLAARISSVLRTQCLHAELPLTLPTNLNWANLISQYDSICHDFSYTDAHFVSRTKQWLRIAAQRNNFSHFDVLKLMTSSRELHHFFNSQGVPSL